MLQGQQRAHKPALRAAAPGAVPQALADGEGGDERPRGQRRYGAAWWSSTGAAGGRAEEQQGGVGSKSSEEDEVMVLGFEWDPMNVICSHES